MGPDPSAGTGAAAPVEGAGVLLDTHHHLDFLPPSARGVFLAGTRERGVRVVAQTLIPSGHRELAAEAGEWPEPHALLSVGFHPWFIGEDDHADAELAVLERAVRSTRFVGEIGLDLSPRRAEAVPRDRQVRVLAAVLDAVHRAAADTPEPYVLSVHAVRSADVVLDLLEGHGDGGERVVPVFHRFGGTSDDLTRLVRMGGCVSVHPAMLGTKKGRAYVRQVPADRLLLETDLPTAPRRLGRTPDGPTELGASAAAEVAATLRSTVDTLCALRREDVTADIARTQRRLYGIEGDTAGQA